MSLFRLVALYVACRFEGNSPNLNKSGEYPSREYTAKNKTAPFSKMLMFLWKILLITLISFRMLHNNKHKMNRVPNPSNVSCVLQLRENYLISPNASHMQSGAYMWSALSQCFSGLIARNVQCSDPHCSKTGSAVTCRRLK